MKNIEEWITLIENQLFAAEDRRIDDMLVRINDKNTSLKAASGIGFMGFTHIGKTYVPRKYQNAAKNIRREMRHVLIPPVSLELAEEVGHFANEVNKIESDKKVIRQLLPKLLRPVTTMQELRDALPDCVANKITVLAEYKRVNPDPTWPIKNDERALREYDRILPRIEFYSVSHLLY